MKGRRLAYTVIGLVLLLAVGISAATLTATDATSGGQSGTGDGTDRLGADRGGLLNFDFIGWALFGAFLLLVFGSVISILWYPLGSARHAIFSLTGGAFVTGLALFVYLLMTSGLQPSSTTSSPNSTNNSSQGGERGFGGGSGDAVGNAVNDVTNGVLSDPSTLGLLVMGIIALGIAAAVFVGDDRQQIDETPTSAAEDRLTEIGKAAGRAADHLEANAPVTNEIYRAWREMTELLEIDDPSTATPGEFRRAAISAGMAAEDVETLTELFEAVRYGGQAVTDQRIERAQSAFRNIAETYRSDH